MSKMNNSGKLTVEDVVRIKVLLREGELTQNEIAEIFGVGRRAIGNINTGKYHADIQIDENGKLIDEKANDNKYKEIVGSAKSRTGRLIAKDVAGIKYILMREYMSDTEIANLFSVERKTINSIKNGTRWKSVEIDAEGNYIEPVKVVPITPKKKPKSIMSENPVEEYVLPHYEVVEEKSDTIESPLTPEEEETVRQKRIFLDGLWKMKLEWKTFKRQKYRSTRIICTNDTFNKTLHKIWSEDYQRWGHINLEEFMAQVAWIVQDAVLKMNIVNNAFDWKLVNSGDIPSLNILFANLQKAIYTGMMHFDTWMQKKEIHIRTKTTNGKKEIFYDHVDTDADSTDRILLNGDGDENKLINLLSEDNGFWSGGDNDRLNHFIQFFEDKKRYFLTQEQYNNWETLVATEHIPGGAGYTKNDRGSLYGIDKSKAAGIRKTVKNRAVKAYQEVYPDTISEDELTFTRLEQRKRQELQLWSKFTAILNDNNIDPHCMNTELSQFILKRLDNPFVFDLIYHNLFGFDLMNVNDGLKSGVIQSDTLYKIANLVEDKVEKLKKFNTSVVPFYRKPEEYAINGQVVDMEECRKIYATNKVTEKEKKKKHTRLRLLATGATFDIDDHQIEGD